MPSPRWESEGIGGTQATNKACQKCRWAHGEAPFEDTPMKGSCIMYPHKNGEVKPNDVSYKGAKCIFFKAEE